jgi:hypothetical protein
MIAEITSQTSWPDAFVMVAAIIMCMTCICYAIKHKD